MIVKNQLIAYAKRPVPGYAKTRLGEKIGFEESAGVYARLLYQCLLELVKLDPDDIRVELSLASDSDTAFFRSAFPEFEVSVQIGSDLGLRLSQSLKGAFSDGAEVVVLIGTDIPDLDLSIIQAAFHELEKFDVVVGPDTDGGYYLIGTREKTAILFRDIDWSSELVLQQTEELVQSQGLSMKFLPTLSDVDTEADFQRWLATRNSWLR
jgi:rSAM/selenodomain-associated transferase 1